MARSASPFTRDWKHIRHGRLGHAERMRPRRLVRRLVQLYVGLMLYGLAGALQVRGNLGLAPWDVFHQGISRHTGLAIGTIVIIVGAKVLVFWLPLRQWPGLGTRGGGGRGGRAGGGARGRGPGGGARGGRI